MSKKELEALFKKYLDGSITPAEFSRLYGIINSGYDQEALDGVLQELFLDPDYAVHTKDYDPKAIFTSLLATIDEQEEKEAFLAPVVPLYRRFWKIAAAAAVLLLAGSLYVWLNRPPAPQPVKVALEKEPFDAPPGRSGAILTLSNGEKVLLDSIGNGTVAMQGRTRLRKLGGQLNYKTVDAALPASAVFYNTMTVPRGRTFKLRLEDGTMVWLNAGSTIRFPTAFTGNERKVEVTGEAYFEVTPRAGMPFTVQLNDAAIEVLGTSFDVADYSDEKKMTTTLLKGAVKLRTGTQELVLTPGQEGNIEKQTGVLSAKEVDTDRAVAWTKGRLTIGNSDFAALMRQISRWYDVDVVFAGKVPDVRIGGYIHRDVNLSVVLEYLGDNGVRYKTAGKTITILP